MSKRTLSVSLLTAGLAAGVLATTVSPAAAQGHPVGGSGNVYYLSGALNATGQAQVINVFGDPDDETYFGDWYGTGKDMPLVRRGNLFFVPNKDNANVTQTVFAYGDHGDKVLIGDWDGDGKDSLAIRRGNEYHLKFDMLTSGKADEVIYYGNHDDHVLVGNWDGNKTPKAAGADGKMGTIDDVSAVAGDGDTLMVVRGNQFFVSNTIKTGVAEYNFFYGDPGDDILVGDWASEVRVDDTKTADNEYRAPQNGNNADQLAVRRGFAYHLSTELEATRTSKKNPTAERVLYYGDTHDTVFVAALPSLTKGQAHFDASEAIDITVSSQPGGVVFDADGVPLVEGYAAPGSGHTFGQVSGVRPAVNGTGAAVTAYTRNGTAVSVPDGAFFTTTHTDAVTAAGPTYNTATGEYLFDGNGAPLLADPAASTTGTTEAEIEDEQAPMAADKLPTIVISSDDTDLATIAVATKATLDSDGELTVTVTGTLVYDRHGEEILEEKASWGVSGDGMGVRRVVK